MANLSLGAAAVDSFRFDPICKAVRKLVDAGVVVVAAAGNNGVDAQGRKVYGQIHSPGIEPSALTVGASNSYGTDARNDDTMTSYSSRGPTRGYWTDAYGVKHYDNLIKPDIVAPGNEIIDAESTQNLLVTQHPELDSGVSSDPTRKMMRLDRNEFFLNFQPIVSIDNAEIRGFEALIRWQHPELGLVPPSEFISIAEEAGLTGSIGAWVLAEAGKQLVSWRDQGLTDCFVSVNLSATQFADAGLVAHVDGILKEHGLNPALLHLEITESVVMENAERACAMLNQLRELGVQVSIDDFGTGYSSLSYLARFPINKLKIDRSLIGEMMTSDETLEVVRASITLAATLKMDVVAEGVETEEQRRILNALNVGYAQGYLFSRPLEASQVVEFFNPTTTLARDIAWSLPRREVVGATLESATVS